MVTFGVRESMLWLISDICHRHGSGREVTKCHVFVIPDSDLLKNQVHTKMIILV